MKFLFSSSKNSSNVHQEFHKNLFLDDEFVSDEDEKWENEDKEDDENDYMFEDEGKCEYAMGLEKRSSKKFKLKHLSLPLTDTIAEIAQELSDEKFFINDLSFVVEMSCTRTISPYAIIVALLYLKRLKSKQDNAYQEDNRQQHLNQTKSCTSSSSTYSSKNIINNYFNKAKQESGLTNAELCLISIILASKYLIDEGETDEIYNYEWAKAADLPVKRLNCLERQFLARLNWDLFVSADEFWEFTGHLTERITRKKVKLQSGQCTYSDLDCLLSFSFNEFFSLAELLANLNQLAKILLICSSTLFYLVLSTYAIVNAMLVVKTTILQSLHNPNNQQQQHETVTTMPVLEQQLGNNHELQIIDYAKAKMNESELFGNDNGEEEKPSSSSNNMLSVVFTIERCHLINGQSNAENIRRQRRDYNFGLNNLTKWNNTMNSAAVLNRFDRFNGILNNVIGVF